jgi:ubiquinone/menaquinone biosynthesis C-methylase UbiE
MANEPKVLLCREMSDMVRPQKERRDSHDRMSKWYDAVTGAERRFVEAGVATLAPAEGERVLEIGYGTGHVLVRLARAVGCSGRVYGVDISDGMRTVAERRIESAGLTSRVHFAAGDAIMLPFDSGCLDAVFMSFTLELFLPSEIPLVLKACARVLTPEGRICVVCMATEQHPGLALRLYEWVHEQFPKAVDCRPITVRHCLEVAGFRVVAASRQRMWGLPLDICLAVKSPAD